jgi:hypothetical protein
MTDGLTAGIEVAPDKLGEALLALRLTSSSGRGGGSTLSANVSETATPVEITVQGDGVASHVDQSSSQS